ncbi:hypothetical protein DIURU_005240 [Diutina rugosa]|uniref:Vacuolar membrane-associated protein IML1 n=1 Tax=Diutina rugosa TaxID=5481 RepID=A0A642UDP4_DIURU|nr:uncharacterized protein DIURU_005240 [Diutina rugosa]KAA8897263.1 hypothetical protein DIURU_005240 [Diutina rugosa]
MADEDGLSQLLSRSMSRPNGDDSLDHLRRAGPQRTSGPVGSGKQFMNRNISATITIGKRGPQMTAPTTLTVGKPAITTRPSTKSLPSSSAPQKAHEVGYTDSVELPVWFHEDKLSEVLIRPSAIGGGVREGDVLTLQPVGGKLKLVFTVDENSLKDEASEETSKEMISLKQNYQSVLNLAPRGMATIARVPNIADVTADSVEIFIKDINMARDSMWNFSGKLEGRCVHQDQRLIHQNYRAGVVRCIYKNGKRMFSGYISKDTHVVYRSESAKLTVLIQLSQEMWHFEETGEILFHKLVNSLFPQMFKRWRNGKTHHSITIVLFTSVDLTTIPWSSFGAGERPQDRRDYFRVVVDQVNILHWDKIMSNLRLEFANFKRDIMLGSHGDQYRIEGEPLPTVKGNILEAINLGLSLQLDRFRNTDLKHSLNNVIIITPGSGLFDVEQDLLRITSDKIARLDCGIDIVCLSPPPLHTTPVFRYLDQGKVRYGIPNWCDISFYHQGDEYSSKQWIPRCKIYELQMMGVTETDWNQVRIERFIPRPGTTLEAAMEAYDDSVFRPVRQLAGSDPMTEEAVDTADQSQMSSSSSSPYAETTLALIKSTAPAPALTGTVVIQGAVPTAQIANDNGNTALHKLYTINKNDDKGVSARRSSNSTIQSLRDVFKRPKASVPESVVESTASVKSLTPSRVPQARTILGTSDSKTASKLSPKRAKRPEKRAARRQSERTHLTTTIGTGADTPEDTDATDPMNRLWMEVDNPLLEPHQNTLEHFRFSRWSEVFPDNYRRGPIKWRAFMAPAALPTSTSLFPSPEVLEHNYTFQTYNVVLADDNYWGISNVHDLMFEMIRLRLALGFQVCYGDAVKKVETERQPGGSAEGLIKYFSPVKSVSASYIYMCYEHEIHRISCDFSGTLTVQLYSRIPPDLLLNPIRLGAQPSEKKYTPLIRTRYADTYSPAQQDFLAPPPAPQQNWNQLDQMMAGYDDAVASPARQFHRMKFVVMPSEVPKNTHLVSPELSDEEIRVDGLRKLVAAIEKDKTKDPEILFYTGNLFDFLSQEQDIDAGAKKLSTKLSTATSMVQLAQELQGPNGLQLTDRKWHFKKHLRSFVGSDFVSWLVENFDDINSRDDAMAFGTKCFEAGMFRHVEQRHPLLDGHYFYKFEEDYVDLTRPDKPKASWFKKQASDGDSNLSGGELRPVDSEVSSHTPHKRLYMLSRSVRFNVDPNHSSDRSEIVTVHYDRVHNPEHCYHIRLQWLNATAKFIDETITGWARMCTRHGLKLVETPWTELCQLPRLSPFHSFVELKLAVNPGDVVGADDPILQQTPFYYHLYFLKKMDFYLDNRSTQFFSKEENVEVVYSWGAPRFKYAQFIHGTGTYMIELRDNGEFFMAPNNTHMIRVNSAIISSQIENDGFHRAPASIDPQKVMLKFRSACQDEAYLRRLFHEARDEWRAELLESV